MSYLLRKDYVQYECTCGSCMSIAELYFCRHCLELRCGYCVCHEVDSHYCSNCMEHLPSAEARLKKNRCSTCFDCPNCFHPLSVRATMRSAEEGSTKSTPTKRYYLSCFFCRWTTRDVNIQDQTVAAGNWPVKENPYANLLTSYLEYYKMIAMTERSQKEKKSYGSLRKGYTSLTDKYGLTAMIARKRAGLPSLQLGGKDFNQTSLPNIAPCTAEEDIEPLPDSFFTQVPDLTKVTTLEQRHANPMLQTEVTSMLHPQHRHFYIKRSLRCRKCEHNVSKPEYNPGSIKFKIQLAAYYHMPEVKIMTFEPLICGKHSEIILKVTNPTQHLTSLQFGDLVDKDEEEKRKAAFTEDQTDEKKVQPFLVPKLKRAITTNTKVVLPTCSVILPPRDDAAEYDDTGDTHNFQDDPKIVVWRKGNKAAIKFMVIPNASLANGDKVIFGFSLEYGYVNTMPTLEQRQPQRTEMQVNVYITPGTVSTGCED
ncbi:dynactin subunit 4 isoform X1 [Rhodnius prolixus]|uniref:Dynactin subunit 4 n=1 Tax=Rhodnius neglectus TaxID=72488 RepID=A0A0P4VW45_9HEMI